MGPVAVEGDTGIVVVVPEAEPVLERWRMRYDLPASQGMPAHVTLLYPFLPESRLDDEVLERLRALCARSAPIDLELRRTARFPETIYLDPEPADPFRQLTSAIVAEWPEAPPYGGRFDEVTPHLTIADAVSADLMDEIEPVVQGGLPVRTRLDAAQLFAFDGARWQLRHSFRFGA
jgi:2'-5' RNA ligase